jgi:hypothetical protein
VKDANRSTQIDTGNSEPKEAPEAQKQAPEAQEQAPEAQGQAPEARRPAQPRKAHRAPPGSSEHHDNQRDLGVGADHVTDEMRRDKRGTFP